MRLEAETHYPDQKPGKMNNRKKTFDAACREMLFDICRNHGLHLDYEPEYGGRAYLEKQDYILMRQKEKMIEQDREIREAQENLDQLTMKIEDIETMINEVSEAARKSLLADLRAKKVEADQLNRNRKHQAVRKLEPER